MNIFEIDIKSTLKYQVMFFTGAMMHLTFLAVFFFTQCYVLMGFNVLSVIIYLTGGLKSKSDSFEKHSFKWVTILYTEITFHATLCTIFLGCGVCFFIYSMMALPVAAFTLFFACDMKKFAKTISVFALITFALLFISVTFVNRFGILDEILTGRILSSAETEVMRNINIFFCTCLIFGFSMLFVMEINTLLKKLHDTNERLNFTATHDALTGLYNRHSLRSFFDGLEKSEEMFCAVMGDIDDFKKINDTYGHDCGDIVLKSVAEIIMNNMDERDLACRWGGEEFLMIMRGTRGECLSRISNVKTQINSLQIDHENQQVRVTMTFGFADKSENKPIENAVQHIPNMDALISIVDKRLYKGKTSGKNVIISDNVI